MHGVLHQGAALSGRASPLRLLAAAILVLASLRCAVADKETHTYTDGEHVTVWTDKVGPYNNPQETYKYDTLGLCELEGEDIKVEKPELSIGEALEGHEFYSSPRLDIRFGRNVGITKICDMKLDVLKAKKLE